MRAMLVIGLVAISSVAAADPGDFHRLVEEQHDANFAARQAEYRAETQREQDAWIQQQRLEVEKQRLELERQRAESASRPPTIIPVYVPRVAAADPAPVRERDWVVPARGMAIAFDRRSIVAVGKSRISDLRFMLGSKPDVVTAFVDCGSRSAVLAKGHADESIAVVQPLRSEKGTVGRALIDAVCSSGPVMVGSR